MTLKTARSQQALFFTVCRYGYDLQVNAVKSVYSWVSVTRLRPVMDVILKALDRSKHDNALNRVSSQLSKHTSKKLHLHNICGQSLGGEMQRLVFDGRSADQCSNTARQVQTQLPCCHCRRAKQTNKRMSGPPLVQFLPPVACIAVLFTLCIELSNVQWFSNFFVRRLTQDLTRPEEETKRVFTNQLLDTRILYWFKIMMDVVINWEHTGLGIKKH